MGIYIVLIPSDGMNEWGQNSKPKKKNASIMGNVLPPNNSVVHKSHLQ